MTTEPPSRPPLRLWLFAIAAQNVTAAYAGIRWAHTAMLADWKVPGGIAGFLILVHGLVGLIDRVDYRFDDFASILWNVDFLNLIYAALSPQSLFALFFVVFLTMLVVIAAMFVLSLAQLVVNLLIFVLDRLFAGQVGGLDPAAMPDDPLRSLSARRLVNGLAHRLARERTILLLLIPVFLWSSYWVNRITFPQTAKANEVTVCLANRKCPSASLSKIVDTSNYLIGTPIGNGAPLQVDCDFRAPGGTDASHLVFIGRSQVRGLFPGVEKEAAAHCARLFEATDDVSAIARDLAEIRSKFPISITLPPIRIEPPDLTPVVAAVDRLRRVVASAEYPDTVVDTLRTIGGRAQKIGDDVATAAVAASRTAEGTDVQRESGKKAVTLLDQIEINTRRGPAAFVGCGGGRFFDELFQFAHSIDRPDVADIDTQGNVDANRKNVLTVLQKMQGAMAEPDGGVSHFLLVGEASADGSPTGNLELSQRRALNVCKALQAELGRQSTEWKIDCVDTHRFAEPKPLPGAKRIIRIVSVPRGEGDNFIDGDPSNKERRRVRVMRCPGAAAKSG